MREGTDEAHYGRWLEINYNLRMTVGDEYGRSPWLQMRGVGRFINLMARQTYLLKYELEFCKRLVSKVTYDYELMSYELSLKLRDSYEL